MKEIQNFYNKYQYPKSKQYTSNQKRTNKKIILKILNTANLNEKDLKNKRILDAGCGTGEKSIFFAKAGAKEIVAIDFSKGQLLEAKKKVKKEKLNNIFFNKKDIINDNLDDLGKFELIVSLGVLHHTKNPKQGYLQIIEQLECEGIIILGLYHKYSRLKYRINRFLLHTFVSKDPEKIVNFILKFKKNPKTPLSTLYDRYCVPYENYHTLKEIKKWFKEKNISYIGCKNIKNEKFEIFNLLEKKTIFFIAGRKK